MIICLARYLVKEISGLIRACPTEAVLYAHCWYELKIGVTTAADVCPTKLCTTSPRIPDLSMSERKRH